MSDKPSSVPEDEQRAFFEAMKGVSRLRHDRADTGAPRKPDSSRDYRREAAVREEARVIDGLSNEAVELVDSNEELLFASPGVQLRLLKRLKQGHIPWDAGLDLHGYSIDEARDQLSKFIRDALRQRSRCVIVVHGKAFSQQGQQPLIKSYVNDWLRQLPGVLAFCSAQPRDGGTGALYVLLKRGG